MINNGRFQILLRRRQNQTLYPPPTGPLTNVIVLCDPLSGDAQYVPGNVDNSTPFMDITPVDGWYDFSNFIDGQEKLSLSWDKVNQGDPNTAMDGSNYDKGITSDLLFFDEGYWFIYNWLMSTECQILNCVEVKIVDLVVRNRPLNVDPAGNYRLFEIKVDNLDYAPFDAPCQLSVKLREQDLTWHCIHKAPITDNWQNWFNETGTSTFDHPCFLTCIEPRPRLVQSVRMALVLLFYSFIDVMTVWPFLRLIVRDWIFGITNDTILEHAREVLHANRFVDSPLIRTYITNIAMKCGLTMDTIFDSGRDWENLCLFYPRSGQMHESNDEAATSPNMHFHNSNRWLITIADLFDKLKLVFCAEWYVTPLNKIVFQYTKDLLNITPIYDFTAPGAVPFYELHYQFNGDKRPAYGEYKYADDGSDEASQEIDTLYSDTVDFDGSANNPMLEGDLVKNFEFAATGFVRDGRVKDYMKLLIEDGRKGAYILLLLVAAVLTAVMINNITLITSLLTIALGGILLGWAGFVASNAHHCMDEFVNSDKYSGAVRLTAQQTMSPRLLLWDGVAMNRAKTVRRSGWPVPNLYFNPSNTAYNVLNSVETDNPNGFLYNYPMYFDANFYDNLYPNYHDPVDNPLRSKETHQKASFYVDLCEDMLNLFGVFQNQYAQIGKVLKLEERDNYDVFVRIGHIEVDYESGRIEITGNVIRHASSSANVTNTNPGNIPVVIPEDPGPPVPTPEEHCYAWVNNGTVDSVVDFRDCDGLIHTSITITPCQIFCAVAIISQSPEIIVAAMTCTENTPPEPPPVESQPCYNFQNIGIKDAIGVSYIDCNGYQIDDVTIPAQTSFCAIRIVNFGTCGIIENGGLCENCNTDSDTNLLRWK